MVRKEFPHTSTEVVVDPGKVKWIKDPPDTMQEELTVQITGYHPSEYNSYDIHRGGSYGICDSDAIIREKIPECECGNEKIYHDEMGHRVCPFCDLNE